MDAPQEPFYLEPQTEALMVLFKVIGRRSWHSLQAWHENFTNSRIEHVLYGIYVLHIPADGAKDLAG